MTHCALGATGAILDHYANVIEGVGYRGIPGAYSNDEYLRSGGASVTASASGTATTVRYASGAWPADYWATSNSPGFWLVCSSGANAGAARKISAWTIGSPSYFTTAAFPSATEDAATYTIAEGFKRVQEGTDIEDELDDGFDRFFRLDALPGEPTDYYGAGNRTYEAEVRLRLRLLKYHRDQDMRASAFENLRIIRDSITKRVNLESTYTRLFTAHYGADTITIDDPKKVVAESTYRLVYRVSTGFD